MTREEFNNLTSEDINLMRENLKKKRQLKAEIEEIDKALEPLNEKFNELDVKINSWIEEYNKSDELRQDELLAQAEELKRQMMEVQEKIAELEEERENKEEELNQSTEERKADPKFISFLKEQGNIIKNKIKINKEEGIKTTKKKAKEYKEKEKENMPLSLKAARYFAKIYVNHKINSARRYVKRELFKENVKEKAKAAADWVKEDIKKGYGYKAAEYINNNKDEIKKVVKLKINRAKSSIARTTKKAVGGIVNLFSNISTYVDNKKTVIVAKTERFINIQKARYEAIKDYNASISELRKNKRVALEEYKKQIEEKERIEREELKNEYQEAVANAKTL